MKNKVCYTMSKPALTEINCGVFTNKKILFESIKEQFAESKDISFFGVLEYEKKTFNYYNLGLLLNTLKPTESFSIRVTNENGMIFIYEITIQLYNKINL